MSSGSWTSRWRADRAGPRRPRDVEPVGYVRCGGCAQVTKGVPALVEDHQAACARSEDDVDRAPRLGRPGRQLEFPDEPVRPAEPEHELLHRQVAGVRWVLERVAPEAEFEPPIESDADALERIDVKASRSALDPAHDVPADTRPFG